MTTERRALLIQTAAIVAGTILTIGAMGLPAFDGRYAKARDVDQLLQEIRMVKTAVDSANLRLTQIKCGPAINLGCR